MSFADLNVFMCINVIERTTNRTCTYVITYEKLFYATLLWPHIFSYFKNVAYGSSNTSIGVIAGCHN